MAAVCTSLAGGFAPTYKEDAEVRRAAPAGPCPARPDPRLRRPLASTTAPSLFAAAGRAAGDTARGSAQRQVRRPGHRGRGSGRRRLCPGRRPVSPRALRGTLPLALQPRARAHTFRTPSRSLLAAPGLRDRARALHLSPRIRDQLQRRSMRATKCMTHNARACARHRTECGNMCAAVNIRQRGRGGRTIPRRAGQLARQGRCVFTVLGHIRDTCKDTCKETCKDTYGTHARTHAGQAYWACARTGSGDWRGVGVHHIAPTTRRACDNTSYSKRTHSREHILENTF